MDRKHIHNLVKERLGNLVRAVSPAVLDNVLGWAERAGITDEDRIVQEVLDTVEPHVPPTLGNRTGNIAIKTELDYNGY
jgi:hypothetical protein